MMCSPMRWPASRMDPSRRSKKSGRFSSMVGLPKPVYHTRPLTNIPPLYRTVAPGYHRPCSHSFLDASPMILRLITTVLLALAALPVYGGPPDGNRLTYLD